MTKARIPFFPLFFCFLSPLSPPTPLREPTARQHRILPSASLSLLHKSQLTFSFVRHNYINACPPTRLIIIIFVHYNTGFVVHLPHCRLDACETQASSSSNDYVRTQQIAKRLLRAPR